MESTRQGQKWSRIVIPIFAPAFTIFFIGFLILQSAVLRPGGIWLQKPDMGNVITENHIVLRFSAYSYTFLPLEGVTVTYWHEGVNLHVWNNLCVFQPSSDKTYTCDFDFIKLKVPVGKKILVNFEVDGILMNENAIGRTLANYNMAPDGWGCFYWKQVDVENPCGRGYP